MTPSIDYPSRRELEGRRIYQALFRRKMPPLLLERYLVAAERLDASLDPARLPAYYDTIESCKDLEALEFGARLTGRLPLLSRKFQAMAYLAETLPDHQADFVSQRSNRLMALASLVSSGVQAVTAGVKGLAAVRGLPHG